MKEEIINKLLLYVNSIEAFTAKEVPLYIKELLEYAIFNTYIDITVTSLFLVFLAFLILACIVIRRKTDSKETTLVRLTAISTILLISVIPIISIIRDYKVIYKIKHAPRVYVIDYLKGVKVISR